MVRFARSVVPIIGICLAVLLHLAFSLKPSKKMLPQTFQTESLRASLQPTGDVIQWSDAGKTAQPLNEVLYKASVLSMDPKSAFGSFGLVEIQFRDSQGFILFSDLISFDDLFSARDYFAYLWVGPREYSQLADCIIQPLTVANYKSVRTRYEIYEKQLKEVLHKIGLAPADKIRPVKTPGKNFPPAYSSDRFFSKFSSIENAIKEIAVPPPREEPKQPDSPPAPPQETIYQKPLERITNEDVEAALKELHASSGVASSTENPTVLEEESV